MITRAELETLLDGFGDEMVSSEQCEIRDRVLDEFYDQPDVYGWAPLTVIEGALHGWTPVAVVEGEVVRDGH